MIKLRYPSSSDQVYVQDQSILFGPIPAGGVFMNSELELNYPHLQTLDEKRGIYGENHVSHVKCSGELVFNGALTAMTHAPTRERPRDLVGSAYCDKQLNKSQIHVEFGAFSPGYCGNVASTFYSSGDEKRDVHFFESLDNGYRYYRIAVLRSNPQRFAGWVSRSYMNFRPSSDGKQFLCDFKQESLTTSQWYQTSVDWFNEPSGEVLKQLPGILSLATRVQSYVKTLHTYRFDIVWTSPAKIAEYVDTNFVSRLINLSFPIEAIHYGLLALDAVKHLQANATNMLEFLRDMRHPGMLIPKLQRLATIRTLSDEALRAQFGILPTISDLRHIVGAFESIKPYIDKNGYKTYNAHCFQSASDKDVTYRLEQRLKLAVDDEDNGLSDLAMRLDNLGAFPRLENLWDLVPYSFVIDWFVDVGQLLQRIDHKLILLQLNIRYVTMSDRKSIEINIDRADSPIQGNLSTVRYHRWVTDHCPAPPLSLELSSDLGKHVFTGGMLVIQHRK